MANTFNAHTANRIADALDELAELLDDLGDTGEKELDAEIYALYIKALAIKQKLSRRLPNR